MVNWAKLALAWVLFPFPQLELGAPEPPPGCAPLKMLLAPPPSSPLRPAGGEDGRGRIQLGISRVQPGLTGKQVTTPATLKVIERDNRGI